MVRGSLVNTRTRGIIENEEITIVRENDLATRDDTNKNTNET